MDADRERAQQLLNHLAPDQVAAVVHVMEVTLDPLSLKLANAPIDDEPLTEEDRQAVAEADEWLKHNKPIPLENVLSEFGLTMADWETMGKTPLPGENGAGNVTSVRHRKDAYRRSACPQRPQTVAGTRSLEATVRLSQAYSPNRMPV